MKLCYENNHTLFANVYRHLFDAISTDKKWLLALFNQSECLRKWWKQGCVNDLITLSPNISDLGKCYWLFALLQILLEGFSLGS